MPLIMGNRGGPDGVSEGACLLCHGTSRHEAYVLLSTHPLLSGEIRRAEICNNRSSQECNRCGKVKALLKEIVNRSLVLLGYIYYE